MTEKQPVIKKGFSADWLMRGALSRIGDALDRLSGRRWTPSSSLATSELIERLKILIDAEGIEVEGKGKVVPHNIKLKIQWDKFSTESDDVITKLENELLIAAADHINDCLYYTYAPLSIKVKPDYFTEGVKLFASFEKFADDEREAELNVTLPSIALKIDTESQTIENEACEDAVYVCRFTLNNAPRERNLRLMPGGRLSVGRTGSNDLIIDDVSVSKVHASLVLGNDDALSIADTGSTNGTFINDERIAYGKAIRLGDGDRVKFGSVDVVFEKVNDTDRLLATDDDLLASGPLSKVDTQQIDESSDGAVGEVDK